MKPDPLQYSTISIVIDDGGLIERRQVRQLNTSARQHISNLSSYSSWQVEHEFLKLIKPSKFKFKTLAYLWRDERLPRAFRQPRRAWPGNRSSSTELISQPKVAKSARGSGLGSLGFAEDFGFQSFSFPKHVPTTKTTTILLHSYLSGGGLKNFWQK